MARVGVLWGDLNVESQQKVICKGIRYGLWLQ